MDFIKRAWMQIQAQLEGLSNSQKWLIATLLILGSLVVGILITFASKPETVPISQFASSNPAQVLMRLKSHGIEATQKNGQIRVPTDQRDAAISLMVEGHLLNDDTSAAFDALITAQSLWTSDSQNQRAYQIAKQKVLSGIVAKMQGVESAVVVIDQPRDRGFGKTFTKPTASVTVTTRGSGVDRKQLGQAVAGLVSGAVAGMAPTDVKIVIDGRMFHVNSPDQMLPSDQLDYVHGLERYQERKISDLLSYIPGVRVAVNVQVGQVAHQTEKAYEFAKTEPLKSEQIENISRRNIQDQGEPGARPNTGLTIAGSGGAGTVETIDRETHEFADKPLVHETQKVLSGHAIEQINVTVSVPRGYFVQVYKGLNPTAKDQPTTAALTPIVNQQLAQIQKQVEPLIQAQAKGQVFVTMIPDASFLAASTPTAPGPTAVGGTFVSSGWVKSAGIGALALLSLGMMLFMVRKATRPETMPSIEELAGVPPQLETPDDLVGEVDEADATLAGVEVNENQMRSRKIADQINDLIKANPNEAGSILGRWVRVND